MMRSKNWGYAASAALIPYAILKTLWAFGVAVLFSEKGIEELHASMNAQGGMIGNLYSLGIDITAILAMIASLLALALVRPWGRRLPRWLLLVPAWCGGLVFTFVSFETLFELITGSIRLSDSPELSPWALIPVYGGFCTWGVTISFAALSNYLRSRNVERGVSNEIQ